MVPVLLRTSVKTLHPLRRFPRESRNPGRFEEEEEEEELPPWLIGKEDRRPGGYKRDRSDVSSSGKK
jgi:hypothetical protein